MSKTQTEKVQHVDLSCSKYSCTFGLEALVLLILVRLLGVRQLENNKTKHGLITLFLKSRKHGY